MEQERDYFGFDEMAQSQKIEAPDSNSTNWSGLGDFFRILAVILSEDPEAPSRLAAAWSMAQGKLQREADVIYGKALPLRDYWRDGPAQKRYFWFAGAEIYALDAWVEGITKKVEILGDLSGEIVDRQQEAKDLYRQFKAEYLASIPAGAAKYGFPPDLAKMEKDDKDLAAKVAAIYAELLKKCTKKIIVVGEKLSKNFVQGAKWIGGAGVIPPEYVGADAAKPWKPYQPKDLLERNPAKDPGADLARLNNEVPGYPGLTRRPVLPASRDPALAGSSSSASNPDTDRLAASAPSPSLTSVTMAGGRASLTPYASTASPALGIPGAVAGRFTGTSQKPAPPQGVPDLTGVALQGRFGEAPQALPDSGVQAFSVRGESILDQSPHVAPVLGGPAPAAGMSSTSMAAAMLGMQQQQTLTGRNISASQPKLFKPELSDEVSGRKRPSGLMSDTHGAEPSAEPKPDLAREPKPVNRPARPTLADKLAAG